MQPRLYLWSNRSLYLGPCFQPRYRHYGAATLVAGLGGPLIVHRQGSSGGAVTTPACLIDPGPPVHIDSRGSPLGVLFLDPLQDDTSAFRRQATGQEDGILRNSHRQGSLVRAFRRLHAQGPRIDSVMPALAAAGLNPERCRHSRTRMDPRVVQAMKLIRDSLGHNVTTADIATALNLSVPRIIQLFRTHMGVSAGRCRQLHRMQMAIVAVACGHSFTAAATLAGFSDLAHFSHTFQGILGAPPTQILRGTPAPRFHIAPELMRRHAGERNTTDAGSLP